MLNIFVYFSLINVSNKSNSATRSLWIQQKYLNLALLNWDGSGTILGTGSKNGA